MKESILRRYMELEEEPETELERLLGCHLILYSLISLFRDIACESTESFVLSSANLEKVKGVLTMLDNLLASNQRAALTAIEKIESLYERLKLDTAEKYQFLSMHQV